MDGAKGAIQDNIPDSGNEILSLLNTVSGKKIFEPIKNIDELINLFTNETELLNDAFAKVPENKNIIGATIGKNYSAKELMDYMIFGLNSHCDTINITLTAGKLTANHRK